MVIDIFYELAKSLKQERKEGQDVLKMKGQESDLFTASVFPSAMSCLNASIMLSAVDLALTLIPGRAIATWSLQAPASISPATPAAVCSPTVALRFLQRVGHNAKL